jgi:hypothetical protein
VNDFGCEHSYEKLNYVENSADLLQSFMNRRAKDELVLHQVPDFEPNMGAFIDTFVFSHTDYDHYSVLKLLTRDTSDIVKQTAEGNDYRAFMEPADFLPPTDDADDQSFYYSLSEEGLLLAVCAFGEMLSFSMQNNEEKIKYTLECDYHTNMGRPKYSYMTLMLSPTTDKRSYNFLELYFYRVKEFSSVFVPHITVTIVSTLLVDDNYTPSSVVIDIKSVRNGDNLIFSYFLSVAQQDTWYSGWFFSNDTLMPKNTPKREIIESMFVYVVKTLSENQAIRAYLPLIERINSLRETAETLEIFDKLAFNITYEQIKSIFEPPDALGLHPYPYTTYFAMNEFYRPYKRKDDDGNVNVFAHKSNYTRYSPKNTCKILSPPNIEIMCITPPELPKDYTNGMPQNIKLSGIRAPANNLQSQTLIVNFSISPVLYHRFVFPGDATARNMYWTLENHAPKISNAFAFCAPHHGSSNTSYGSCKDKQKQTKVEILADYLQNIHPNYHIISSGSDNTYGLPNHDYVLKSKDTPAGATLVAVPAHYIYESTCAKPRLYRYLRDTKAVYTTVSIDPATPSNPKNVAADNAATPFFQSFLIDADSFGGITFTPQTFPLPIPPSLSNAEPHAANLSFGDFIFETI